MLAIILSPIYLFIVTFAINRWFKFINELKLSNCKVSKFLKYASFIMYLLTLCIPVGFLTNNAQIKRICTIIGNYWLGVSIYLMLGVLVGELVLYVLRKIRKDKYNSKYARFNCVVCVILFTVFMSVYGIINAKIVRKTEYDIKIDKQCFNTKELTIGLIADTHFGYNIGEAHLKQTVDILNESNCDFVVIAGDVFDNDFDAIENPEKLIELFNSIKTKYGVYGVLGNHDVEEKILCGFTFDQKELKLASQEMLDFISKANIKILYDQFAYIGGAFYLYGRPDYERPNIGKYKADRNEVYEIVDDIDLSKPVFVIDHAPRDYKELKEAGVDLDLSGHTHDGQIWPTKYACYLIWDNPYGLYQDEGFNAITTSGVGLFGPNIRTFTIPEVCIIHVKFAE